MRDFIPPMLRWDDSMYPILISECRRYLIDGEHDKGGYFALVRLPASLLSYYQDIDAAKLAAYRNVLARVLNDTKQELGFYGIK